MSKYKFIGTEQDLIDNGFEQRLVNFIRGTKEVVGGLIRVNVDNKLSREYPFCNENFDFYDGVGSSLVHIQDLIDKGLVIKDE